MKKLIMILATTIISFGASAQYAEDCNLLYSCDLNKIEKLRDLEEQSFESKYNKIPQSFYQ